MAATYEVGEGYASALNQTAIDLIPGDLAVQGVQSAHVYYYDADDHSVAYAETLDIYTGFSNGSATDYIDVQAMVSHNGMRDSGIIIDVSGNVASLINIGSDYTRFHGFCIQAPTISYAGTSALCSQNAISYYYNNVVYDIANTNTAQWIYGCRNLAAGINIYNNIILSTYANIIAISTVGAGTAGLHQNIHNNVVLTPNSASSAIWSNVDYVFQSNNYGYSGDADFYCTGNTNGVSSYNISADATAPGTNALINKAAVDQFESVTAGAENLDLRYMGACYRKGQDNSSLFTTDCAGNNWSLWETGALAKQYKRIYNVDGDETDQITSNGVIIP